jgi:hypothetical protein
MISRFYATLTSLFILTLITAGNLYAQSTSPWVKVIDDSGEASATTAQITPTVGDTYLTVDFVSGRLHQNSTWWTNFVERNRVGVVDVTLTGRINGTDFEDTRTSGPIELRRNNSLLDVGFSQNIVRRLPTTYSNLQMRVRISKSSKDGLGALITTLSEISNKTPGLQPSQAVIGAVSAAKSIASFLFQEKLVVEHLRSVIQFPDSGETLKPGLWASLAADSTEEYVKYLSQPPANGTGLTWDGSRLLWNDHRLQGVTYFVVRVSYSKRVFEDPLASLSFSKTKPWAALYQIALEKIDTITNAAEAAKIAGEIHNHLINGNTLLNNDPDYIRAEQKQIREAVNSEAQRLIDDRINKILAAAPGSGGGVPPKPRIIMTVPEDTLGEKILRNIQKEEAEHHKKEESKKPAKSQ